MSMFQKSVINKYLTNIDQAQIETAYQSFKSNYSSAKIEKIKRMKEEEYQDGFLRDLFVNFLGYTLKPDDDFNLVREFKNQTDSKKADGAILKDGNAIAVIELKSTKTKELKSITEQAFNYKNNQPECKYVITSNFQKLRFYIDHSNEYIEFNLFNLAKEEFEVLYLVLSKESIFADTPIKLKKETIYQEENISKQFYKDYSSFKNKLFENLVKNNSEHDKLTLFKKTQKLIDRFLFILFAEDRGLLPPNLINSIIQRYTMLEELDHKQPLYDIYKQFFGYLNTGHTSKKATENIPAYNGGLFYPDEILDKIIIDDETLISDLQKLSSYDFNTEVDVNILGHIFEHSLAEIEEITAELDGIATSKAKSKRKKDGVFYTPKYITQYIVENTIGKLCSEKRNELELTDIEIDEKCYLKSGKLSEKGKKLYSRLETYKAWLLSLKIVDPACGSGAFLNQALNFLIEEHQFIIDLETDLNKGQISLFNIEKAVLENNLYGVDINEESIEIAKLSLWLRTAQKGRRLTVLSNNIKCGNSLVDDPEIAGHKSFNWQKEFPEVFEEGGFDIVIGNPPYGAELSEKETEFIANNYITYEYQLNSYVVFYEKGINLLRNGGVLGYITPSTFTYQHYFKKLRSFINERSIINIAKYFYEVFPDADIGDSVSWIIKNKKNNSNNIEISKYSNKNDAICKKPEIINYKSLVNRDGTYNLSESTLDFQALFQKGQPLGELCEIIVGVKAYQTNKGRPKQTKEIVKTKIFTATKKKDETYINCIIGKNFHRYRFTQNPQMYLSYGEWLAEPRKKAPFFEDEKIILRQTSDSLIGTLDTEKRINLNNVYNIGRPIKTVSNKYLLGLLNSKLLNIVYQNIAQEKGRLFAEVKKVNLSKIPIIVSNQHKHELENKVSSIMELNNQLTKIKIQFVQFIMAKFALDDLDNKLKNWQTLDYLNFIKELNKSIKKAGKEKLSKLREMEWMEIFETKKEQSEKLLYSIQNTDKEIDQLVYAIYGLSEQEIQLIETSSN